MKAVPALPTITTREVHRIGEVSRATGGRKSAPLSRLPAPAAPAPDLALKTKPAGDGVLRVVNKALGISCPCSTPAVAAQLTQFFKR